MLPPKRLPDTWQEALKIINRCPICTTEYRSEAAKLFAREENATLIHFTCGECRSYFVAMIMSIGPGLSSVGMVTDLSLTDVERLYKQDILTIDEVLEHYQELHDTNFVQKLKVI